MIKDLILYTLICATRLPHTNLSTIFWKFSNVVRKYMKYLFMWLSDGFTNQFASSFCDLILPQGNFHG